MAKWNTPEDKRIEYLETRYCYEKRQKIYIANETTNQVHDETDIVDVIQAWNNNWTLGEIADWLGTTREETELLILDLIHQKKIDGNIHVFKPKKRKGPEDMEIMVGETIIRAALHDRKIWVCMKDLWRWIGKPEHSYRKVTESWGPDRRAKFKLETGGGRQNFIFINMSGLSKLFEHVEENQKELLHELIGVIESHGMGISSGHKRIAN